MDATERRRVQRKVLIWTLQAPWVMRRGPAGAFEAWRTPRPRTRIADVQELLEAADAVLLARLLGKLVFRTRCLKRTLVLWRLLRAYGHDAVAIIGLDREESGAGRVARLAGHAWLEVEGRRIRDPVFTPPREFVPFLAIGDRTEALTDPSPTIPSNGIGA